MKNEEYNIVAYSKQHCEIGKLAEMHRLISKHSKVAKCLIYSDKNFVRYLENKVVISDSDYIFLLLANEEVAGFCRLRYLDNQLFLNNIYIFDKFQGKGLGSFLLLKSLKQVLLSSTAEIIKLDVFASNTSAISWYEKIGFKKIDITWWYLVKSGSNFEDTFIYPKTTIDSNGFTSIIFNENRIGSMINKTKLFTSLSALDFLSVKYVDKSYLKVNSYQVDYNGYMLCPLESSYKLEAKINQVLEYLVN